jgi:N6-L-threonylcarbamoyladenine synthase
MRVLAIESSCDETAAAVVEDREICSSIVRTQIETHRLYGGVVPEIASRAHAECISTVVGEALKSAGVSLSSLDGIAVTAWPGLIGALLVGVGFAKGLALAAGLPLVPVHHLRGHIAAAYLADKTLTPPFLALVVSGGHTSLVYVEDYTVFKTIGRTRDDAAGECLDKVARVLGLPYPGGAALSAIALGGDPAAFPFPDAVVKDTPLDFSFSGIKTAAVQFLRTTTGYDRQDFAASFCGAVVNALSKRLETAARQTGAKQIVIAGGVAANSYLRAAAANVAQTVGAELILPPVGLCGDNAAMIGAQGIYELGAGNTAGLDLNAMATRTIE